MCGTTEHIEGKVSTGFRRLNFVVVSGTEVDSGCWREMADLFSGKEILVVAVKSGNGGGAV